MRTFRRSMLTRAAAAAVLAASVLATGVGAQPQPVPPEVFPTPAGSPLRVGDIFTTPETQLVNSEILGTIWTIGPDGLRHEITPARLLTGDMALFAEGEFLINRLDRFFAEMNRPGALPGGTYPQPQGRLFTFGENLYMTYGPYRWRVEMLRVAQSVADLYPQGLRYDRLDIPFRPPVAGPDAILPAPVLITGRLPGAGGSVANAGVNIRALHPMAGRIVSVRMPVEVTDPTAAYRNLWLISPVGTRHEVILANATLPQVDPLNISLLVADNIITALQFPTERPSPVPQLNGRLFYLGNTLWFAYGNWQHQIEISYVTSGELESIAVGHPLERVDVMFVPLLQLGGSATPGMAGANISEPVVFGGQ